VAKIPPTKYVSDWGSTGRVSKLAEGKQETGYTLGEVPGSSHINHLVNRAGNWQKFISKTMGAQIAYSNMEYKITELSDGASSVVDSKIEYDHVGDHWYWIARDTGSDVIISDSADGETWSASVKLKDASALNFGAATNGTILVVVSDDTVYVSSDLTVANLDAGRVVTDLDEARDIVYDESTSRFIIAGSDSSNDAATWWETSPTDTNWSRQVVNATTGDAIAIDTDRNGRLACCTSDGDTFYSTNGASSWTAGDTAAILEFVRWAPTQGLFIGLEATGELWTSEDGDTWRNQNSVKSFPLCENISVGEDFVMCWKEQETTTTAGLIVQSVYAIVGEAVSDDGYNYVYLGDVASLDGGPDSNVDDLWMVGGQGKVPLLHNATGGTSGQSLALGRYGGK
jgi:hypothetical protein